MIQLAQIGVGYWGKNLLRNFYSQPQACVKKICDLNKNVLEKLSFEYRDVTQTVQAEEIFEDHEIDAVVIATPADSHFSLAQKALESEKHIFVEKPLALTSVECQRLNNLALERNRILMVGHTFLYNAAVNKVKEYIIEELLGNIYYIYSQRLNLGRIRQEVNAMWNFAPHDISIILHWLDKLPHKVSARGYTYIQDEIPDVVFLHMEFENGVSAQIHVSWLDPGKMRKMTIVGSKKMIVYDDVEVNAKIQIYDKGITKKNISASLGDFDSFGKFQLIHRAGDLLVPKIDFVEPLKVQCSHFLECILKGRKPITDGESGLIVVKILEAAQKSIENDGRSETVIW
ncbi:MAG: Gfo/Idh/MocA family protein [bacterium]